MFLRSFVALFGLSGMREAKTIKLKLSLVERFRGERRPGGKRGGDHPGRRPPGNLSTKFNLNSILTQFKII